TERWTTGATKEASKDWVVLDNFTIDFSGLDVPEVHYETFNLLEICPNPASSTVEIKTDLDDEYNITIYNMMGIKVLERQEFTNGTLDISALPTGIYFIKATKDGKGIAKRIMKE
ncbi:MAG: T9SS type A sorting domain-containing protein, partial [Bacteroidales bacterium]|nr:T9SS type A sorting domain-containing protein [Bacteroidales bacterium]